MKKYLLLLPLATLLIAGCTTTETGKKNTRKTKYSDLPTGGKISDIFFAEEDVRTKFANDIEEYVTNIMSSKTFEAKIDAKANEKLDVQSLGFVYEGQKVTLKTALNSDVDYHANSGISFLNQETTAYALLQGKTNISLSYELPDVIYNDIPTEIKDQTGLKQKNSDSLSGELGANIYLKNRNLYIDATHESNKAYAKSIANNKLFDLKKLITIYDADYDLESSLEAILSQKYVVEVGDTSAPDFSEYIPEQGRISGTIINFLNIINNPEPEYAQYVELGKDILNSLNFKTYIYSSGDYTYGFELGVSSLNQIQNAFDKISNFVAPNQGTINISQMLAQYGVNVNNLNFRITGAIGPNAAFVGFEENIAGSVAVSLSGWDLNGSASVGTDYGMSLKASNDNIDSKLPNDLDKYVPFDVSLLPDAGRGAKDISQEEPEIEE